MKTDEKTRKNVQNDAKKRKKEQISAIYSAIDYLRGLGIVKNQKEFAEYIGVTQQAISYALREDSEFSNKRLMHRIEEKMKADHNYDIYAPHDIYVTGDAIAAPSAPADTSIKLTNENEQRLLKLLDERDAQINRLLTLLENEQKKHL